MTRAALRALLSHWMRAPFQLVTLMAGLAIATALWSGVQAINAEARKSYDRAATGIGASADSVLTAEGGVPHAVWIALRRAGWPVTPILEGQVDTAAGPLRLVGVDPFTLPAGELPAMAEDGTGDGAAPALAFITPPGQLLVAPATAATLAGADLPPMVEAPGMPPGTAYADIGIAQSLLGRDDVGRLLVLGPPPLGAAPIADIAPGLSQARPEAQADLGRLTDSFHLNLTAFGLLSFAVGLFIVRGAIGLAFEQRRQMFRTLRALGLSRARLLALLTAELMILSLAAGTLGVALGWLMASLLIPDVAATLRGLYGADVAGGLTLAPSWWLSGLAIAVLGTGVAAAASLWRTATMPLLAPAQPRAWARASEGALRLQGAAALACLAVAGIAWGAFDGLVAGFVLLGGLLIAAALALPVLLHVVLAGLARTAIGPRSEWFWADTRQQLPGLSLALMALLLALATNIGVGTMVSSFRLTFTGWLDQRLAAELYVRADSDAQAARIRSFVAPRTDAILPIRSVEADLAGIGGEIVGVADHPTYFDRWPLVAAGPDVWRRVGAGAAVLVNEQFARRTGTWPGGTVDLAGWQAPVAGVYSDYGNPRPQVMIGLDRFAAMFPEAPDSQFGLRLDPGGVAALRRAILDRFDLPADRVTDQASVKQLSLSVFDRTFTVTSALNVLTLAVSGLAILTSLLTIATMRRPQLAPVWALGLTRRRLARLEVLRALLLALLTFVAAIPVGLALAWILLAVINVEAFGWRLPMHLFPTDWLRLLALSALAAALAAAIPARRLARTPPADLLKVFAHER